MKWKTVVTALRQDKQFFVIGLLVFVLMPMAGNWLSEAIAEWWLGEAWTWEKGVHWIVMVVVGLAIVIIGLYQIWTFGQRFIRPEAQTIRNNVSQRKLVIALLSTPGAAPAAKLFSVGASASGGREWRISNKIDPPVAVRTLDDWVRGDQLTSWQQLARGLHYHWRDGHLERVILITSGNSQAQPGHARDSGGSDRDADIAVALFTDVLNVDGRRVLVEVGPERAVDFENLENVVDALGRALNKAYAMKYTDADIVIDVTGGQKTTSIAGALVTLDRRDLIFQYVPSGATGVVIPKAYQVVARASNLSV